VWTFFGQRGWDIRMRTSALFGAKNFGFFEIYGVSAQTKGEGVEPVRTRGRGSILTILCGRLLRTASYCK